MIQIISDFLGSALDDYLAFKYFVIILILSFFLFTFCRLLSYIFKSVGGFR